MPRLKDKVDEPRQQGVRTGATPAVKERTKRKREQAETPLGADRATRGRPVGPAKRANLTPDEQAKLLVEFKELPPKKQRGSRGLTRLAKKYKVNKQYPAALLKAVKKPAGKLPTRKGVGGQPVRITADVEQEIISVLRENAYDLTFKQIEEKTGIPASTIHRHMQIDFLTRCPTVRK